MKSLYWFECTYCTQKVKILISGKEYPEYCPVCGETLSTKDVHCEEDVSEEDFDDYEE